jgi:hypothetical protein
MNNDDDVDNRMFYRFVYENIYTLADKMAVHLVDLLKDIYEEDYLNCPNRVSNCGVFHTRDADRHDETWDSLLVPSYLATTEQYLTRDEETWGSETQVRTFWYANPRYENLSTSGLRLRAGLAICNHCEDLWLSDHIEVFSNTRLCWSCREDYIVCTNCENAQHIDNAFYDEDDEQYFCEECWYGRHRTLTLHNYTYKPDPIFKNHLPLFDKKQLYMGMELEVARNMGDAGNAEINGWITQQSDSFIYVKSDVSVDNGFEIVTHPFTYEWATAHFPYGNFDNLCTIVGVLDTHSSAGTHIHLSKEAFTSVHLWKFIKFHIDNPTFVGALGGRGTAVNYGNLDDLNEVRKDLKEIAQFPKDHPYTKYTRQHGINLNPEYTIELRYMASGIRSKTIKKNQQWAQAVFDYTKRVNFRDAKKGAFADPGYFLGYIEDFDYPELKDFIQSIFPTPKQLDKETI